MISTLASDDFEDVQEDSDDVDVKKESTQNVVIAVKLVGASTCKKLDIVNEVEAKQNHAKDTQDHVEELYLWEEKKDKGAKEEGEGEEIEASTHHCEVFGRPEGIDCQCDYHSSSHKSSCCYTPCSIVGTYVSYYVSLAGGEDREEDIVYRDCSCQALYTQD